MKIAIASGKGGTGKTTVATNLAFVAARAGWNVVYADCDVEEPNGHLFLNPALAGKREVNKLVPRVNAQRCDGCGECGRFCQFHAIINLGARTMVYPELCHSCGGCERVCPQGAITEHPRRIGDLDWGEADGVHFFQGRLLVGEPQSPPVIRALKTIIPPADLVLLDAPPGTSCPVVEVVRDADLLLLVAEPTPFGLHDLRLALDMAKILDLNCGAVINRAVAGRSAAREFCKQEGLPILAEIPDDLAVAQVCAEGKLAVEVVLGLRQTFAELLVKVTTAAKVHNHNNVRSHREPMIQNASDSALKHIRPDNHSNVRKISSTP